MSVDPVTFLEGLQDRDDRLRLGLVALEEMKPQREPGTGRPATRPEPAGRRVAHAHPDLAQLVLVISLEVKRGRLHDHRRQSARARGMAHARLRGRSAILAFLAALQGPEERPQTRMRSSDLLEHPQESALLVGSMIRARTIARNASSPQDLEPPKRRHAGQRVPSSRERVEVIADTNPSRRSGRK